MGSVTAYEPSHPLKQRKTAEYGTREPYYRSLVLRPRFLPLVWLAFLACSREEKRPERTEPWPATSASAAVTVGSAKPALRRARYALEQSNLSFELPAKRATPRGRLSRATGTFELDVENTARSSGSVRVDLTSLEMVNGAEDGSAADATRRALEWLELGNELASDRRALGRFATFDVRGLEGTDGKSIGTLRARRDGRAPRIDATVVGDLSLHGVRAPQRVPVTLEIEGADGETGAPSRLVIRSQKPVVVSLGVHDIRPRDARGVLVARELTLLGESVGRDAKVSFELTLALTP
jgi:polyisoprenoid-binding protein YceI